MNFGFPLLCEDTELLIEPAETIPRDPTAKEGLSEFRQMCKPRPGFQEQVFFHKMNGDAERKTSVKLLNKKTGVSAILRFNVDQLPYLTQWKMMGQGEYALGLEPGNVPVKDRKELREENKLPTLQPGESAENSLELEFTGS